MITIIKEYAPHAARTFRPGTHPTSLVNQVEDFILATDTDDARRQAHAKGWHELATHLYTMLPLVSGMSMYYSLTGGVYTFLVP